MLKRIAAMLCALLMLFLGGCRKESESLSVYVMNTVCTLDVSGGEEKVLDDICGRLLALDAELSSHTGDVKRLNDLAGGEMSEDTARLLERSLRLSSETDGLFSPILGSVTELWGIGEKNNIPTEETLAEALLTTEPSNVAVQGRSLRLSNGARLNFGAVAKGYAGDEIKKILEEKKVPSACISLGGNVYVKGMKRDGTAWNVAIRDPNGTENDWLGSLALEDKFVISSGAYERYFNKDGKTYHHIIDPRTGFPCITDLSAVAVITEDGTLGDAYSTALFIMGEKKSLDFWREREGFELVLVGNDGKVTVTEGLWEKFTPNENRGYTYETAYR